MQKFYFLNIPAQCTYCDPFFHLRQAERGCDAVESGRDCEAVGQAVGRESEAKPGGWASYVIKENVFYINVFIIINITIQGFHKNDQLKSLIMYTYTV